MCDHRARVEAIVSGWTECPACLGIWDRPPPDVLPDAPPSLFTERDLLSELERRVRLYDDARRCRCRGTR